ncbi:MAG: hypothetical protein ISP90_16350 [Nevskia sp.]|nr:hypothetical protein [Nevskia sp.]
MSAIPFPAPSETLAYAALGVALGLAHFGLLRWNLSLYLRGQWRGIGMQVLRFAAVASAFALLARSGAWPLLLGLSGFMLGRMLILRRVNSP